MNNSSTLLKSIYNRKYDVTTTISSPNTPKNALPMPQAYYKSEDKNFTLLSGNCIELLKLFEFKFDMIFADPPYFLSNGGFGLQSGKVVSVNKGEWDKSQGADKDNEFNYKWLSECRNKLTETGTIWVSGTYHNIFSIANCLAQLGFKILNIITWQKTNPPRNISCRFFTHSTEFIIWARKNHNKPHYFNYELMKELNGGHQMTDVWRLPAIAPWEKKCTKHPTQKPLSLLTRIIQAASKERDWVLDPFAGSSTTGIAANLLGRRYLGIEQEAEYLAISIARRKEIENTNTANTFRKKIERINGKAMVSKDLYQQNCGFTKDILPEYSRELPF